MNPIWHQKKLREYCESKGIVITAYSPLGASGAWWGTKDVMNNELLKEIADAHGKSIAQLRHHCASRASRAQLHRSAPFLCFSLFRLEQHHYDALSLVRATTTLHLCFSPLHRVIGEELTKLVLFPHNSRRRSSSLRSSLSWCVPPLIKALEVVDAKNVRFQLNEHRGSSSSSFPEAYFQIAFADIIILNKVDLVSAEGSGALEELEEEIHNINSLVEIIHSVRCQVDLSKILNRKAYETGHAAHLEALLEESNSLSTKKLHDSGIRTICISDPQTIDLDKARIWLEEILWEKKYDMDVYRCKGVLSVQNSDQLHTLQAVRELYEIVPTRKWETEENRINKIVFIGHNLKEDVLIESFGARTRAT